MSGEKFIACGEDSHGGAHLPGIGTSCRNGRLLYWAKYNGRDERFSRRCECLSIWLQRNPKVEGAN